MKTRKTRKKPHGERVWRDGISMRQRKYHKSWIQGHVAFLRALAKELFRF